MLEIVAHGRMRRVLHTSELRASSSRAKRAGARRPLESWARMRMRRVTVAPRVSRRVELS